MVCGIDRVSQLHARSIFCGGDVRDCSGSIAEDFDALPATALIRVLVSSSRHGVIDSDTFDIHGIIF